MSLLKQQIYYAEAAIKMGWTRNLLLNFIKADTYHNAKGNKIEERVIPENEQMLGLNILYQYTDGKLTKEEIVLGNQSPQYILYEYNGDKLMKTKSPK